jgi:hypothetical protein
VESRRVTTLLGLPPYGAVGRLLTARSRPPAGWIASVRSASEVSSAAVPGSRPNSATGRSSAPGGRSSSRLASSLASSSRPSSPTISTPSRTACSTALWWSYIRANSVGPRPLVSRCSRRAPSAVPTAASTSAAAAEPSRIGMWLPTTALTLPTVMLTATTPFGVPLGAKTGTAVVIER